MLNMNFISGFIYLYICSDVLGWLVPNKLHPLVNANYPLKQICRVSKLLLHLLWSRGGEKRLPHCKKMSIINLGHILPLKITIMMIVFHISKLLLHLLWSDQRERELSLVKKKSALSNASLLKIYTSIQKPRICEIFVLNPSSSCSEGRWGVGGWF